MKLTVFAALFAFACCSPVAAGSYVTFDDPVVIGPECTWFGVIPCHTGFDYDEPEGDTPVPHAEPKPKGKGKKDKAKRRC